MATQPCKATIDKISERKGRDVPAVTMKQYRPL